MRHPSLEQIAHRPWPVPPRPWIGRQTWNDLAFLHWPVVPTLLRSLVPPDLEIDEFDGSAWIAVTPFWMSGVALRGWPEVPGVSTFPELNVRTYVTRADRPGVWFFSLDAGSRLAVHAARAVHHLPYVHASMSVREEGGQVRYQSDRRSGTGFHATYGPTGPVFHAEPGTLEHWLTERYCLYARSGSGRLYRAEIHHAPWPLQPASVRISRNDMLTMHHLPASGAPALVHFARRLDVIVWLPTRLAG
jgi:uncharacterized protein YqjF (DUF2071 family)